MNWQELKAEFNFNDIDFRAGATNKDKTSALALAYLTSRAVMDRLDNVCGPENWQDEYQPGPNGGVICGLSIRVDNQWITKWDGADNTNIEGVKGGLSDSFKRAAVKWGIGRYLYSLPAVWVTAKAYGNTVKIDENEARAKAFGKQPGKPETGVIKSAAHTPVIISEPVQVTTEPKAAASKEQNGNDKKKSDPWPAKSGPLFEWCQAVRAVDGGYYDNQYQLVKAVGGAGAWLNNKDEREAKLSEAIDRIEGRKAEKAEAAEVDEDELPF